jgi:tRNA (guanine-N7-)-methyltransferase
MDYFLKEFSDKKSRKGRVVQFFTNELSKSLSLTNNLFDLEIGCGHGHWLNAYSDINRDITCVGIDLISKRIQKSNNKKDSFGRNNLFFYKAEANEFLHFKPLNIKIRNIFILFPDPWPKKRHHKRRLIQNEFLDLLKLHVCDKSLIYFRTDHLDYFKWTEEKFQNSQNWKIIGDKWPFEHETFFQNLLPNYKSLVAKFA